METSKTRVTADEFLELPETLQPPELLDGEIIVSPTPTTDHQRIVLRLTLLLSQKVTEKGGEVALSPLDVRFDEFNVVQPDVMWLAPNSRCTEIDQRLSGPPELVIEVLSPSTSRRDKREKFRLYERHGVTEYWIVDPSNRYVELWHLVDGRFQAIDTFTPGETFESPQLGEIIVDAIFEQMPPAGNN